MITLNNTYCYEKWVSLDIRPYPRFYYLKKFNPNISLTFINHSSIHFDCRMQIRTAIKYPIRFKLILKQPIIINLSVNWIVSFTLRSFIKLHIILRTLNSVFMSV